MEQATNTFNKGLQTDTNPMIQGNDTLTDCLNGTLITMNGNEVILQNDMGNRRVDNAYLPSGYEPVGMKEYGGIIYVAAYNPITNKSQIGSFPSPQKKIDSLDDPSLKGTFYFEQFLSGDSQYGSSNIEQDTYLGINIIKTDSFMVPLTGETSLRAGDKFAIYAPGISQYGSSQSQITNFFNTSGNKAYSPKNRRYTLQIGILNSQNEFVDITKTLCRWKNNVLQNYSSEKSDIFKFNDGYFISEDFTDKLSGSTIDDTKLIRKRQKMAANTYAYKLVGPMYLKANLNHIENFNYNIYGTRNDNGSATLWIEGYLSYNCPDGFTGIAGSSNESYSTFSEGVSSLTDDKYDFKGFDLIGTNDYEDLPRENSVYNSSNNLYTTKIVKKYTNITANNGTIYDYVIGVLADKDTPNIYLKGLSVKGQLDLSLLGSGKVFIDGWRFYNNFENQSTALTFSFNAYPEYGKSFGNLKFTFKDIIDQTEKTYPREGGLPLYNGRQTYNIEWQEYFKPSKVYKVTITYDIINENGSSSTETLVEKDSNSNTIKRWFLTTELFNEFYQPSAGVPDFCDLSKVFGNTEAQITEIKNRFNDKMKVNIFGKGMLKNQTTPEETYDGSLTSETSDISYICEHTYNINIQNNSQLSILNKQLYPDFISIKDEELTSLIIDSSNTKIKSVGNVEPSNENESTLSNIFKELISTKQGSLTTNNSTDQFDKESILSVSLTKNSNNIQGKILYKDIYKAYNENPISEVENVFSSLSNIIDEGLPANNFHAGLQVNFKGSAGGDPRFLEIAGFQEETISLESGRNLGYKYERLEDIDDMSGRKDFYFNNYSDRVYSYFNNSLWTPGQMFQYIFQRDNYFPTNIDNNSGLSGESYTRLWWRMSNGEWAIFNTLLNKKKTNGGVKQFILNNLKHDYVYCMYNNYMDGDLNLYAPGQDYIYTDDYIIPLILEVNYNTTKSVSEILNIPNNTKVGNLQFIPGEMNKTNSDEIVFNLSSSQNFQDYINSFDPNSISNIDLETGLQVDSKNRKLNPNYIYYRETKNGVTKLIRVNNSYLQVDTFNTINGKNTLVYNHQFLSVPSSRPYQSVFHGDGDGGITVLIYNSVNIIQEI